MKILNLYAGIGGNRKFWKGHEVTAVEYDPYIAQIYKDYYPEDDVIVGDAHEYLLKHFKEYDFIWSSPPCPTHSRQGLLGMKMGQHPYKYPEMSLYQEIIFLQEFAEGGYCVENVIPYYKPLIAAQKRDRHLFWCNFYIREMNKAQAKMAMPISESQKLLGYDLSGYKVDKRKVLRNCVMPEVGQHILDCFINQQPVLL